MFCPQLQSTEHQRRSATLLGVGIRDLYERLVIADSYDVSG